MIAFRTFGRLDLRAPDGAELASVLVHPKRTALLCYLAAARPRGFHRRDALLALLWPELDQEHARAALRKAVYHLRRSLGEEVVVGRGDEELATAPDRLWCDATAFEESLAAGDAAAALELYAGEFLSGFYIPEALEFERWVEAERAHLRQRAADGAWSLAMQDERVGDVFGAAAWARRAVELAPADEAALRRSLQLLDRIGDRSGAIAAYEEFARRLARDYQLEPSAETRALIGDIRRAGGTPEAAGVEPHAPASATPPSRAEEPAERPPSALSARARIRAGWRRPGTLAAAAGVSAIAALVAGRTLLQRNAEAPAVPAPTVVAVLPFAVRGDPALEYLGEGIASLLSAGLDGAAELRAVDPAAVLGSLDSGSDEPIGPEAARALARRFDAGLYILGDVVAAGGRVRVNAALYDARAGERPRGRAAVEGESHELFRLVDGLAAQLLAQQVGASAGPTVRMAAVTTASLAALKAYLEGERELRRGRYDRALAGFRRATAEDSTFALAWYRLSLAAEWFSRGDLQAAAAERAVRYMDRLSEPDQSRLRAFLAWRRGAADEAERLYRGIVGTYPDDSDAWMQLGEVWFHYGPLRGRPISRSREAWQRVRSLEPHYAPAVYHLARIAAVEEDRRALDSLTALVPRLNPESERALEMRALRAFALRLASEQRDVLGELENASDNTLIITTRSVLTYSGGVHDGEALARLLVSPRRTPEVQGLGYLMLAQLAGARGQWRLARARLDTLATLLPAWALEYRAFLALAPHRDVSAEELRETRAALVEWNAEAVPPSETPGLYVRAHDGVHPELRLFLAGALSARLGESRAASRYADELERGSADGFAASLAHRVRAQMSWRRGELRSALRRLDAGWHETIYDYSNNSPFFSQGAERFLRAEILRALGRESEALTWYASLGEVSPYELVFLAPATLRRAEIAERLGDPASAARFYTRFLELWQDSDPEHRPLVEDVRRRFERLRAGREQAASLDPAQE
ncbi:MAG: hypothetical protein HY561_04635 [Gemmatimonadetes bacterium]|nr:hypothetical protein [Gemmatimonadota bacterium]